MRDPTLICVPIMGESVDKMVIDLGEAKASGADLVEIRLDSLKSFNPHEHIKSLISSSPLPTLFTYRFGNVQISLIVFRILSDSLNVFCLDRNGRAVTMKVMKTRDWMFLD